MRQIKKAVPLTIEHGGVTFLFRRPSALESVIIFDLLLRPMQHMGKEAITDGLGDLARSAAATVGLLWHATSPLGPLDSPAPAQPWTREILLAYGALVLAEISEAGLGFADVQDLSMALMGQLTGSDRAGEVAKVASFTEASAG